MNSTHIHMDGCNTQGILILIGSSHKAIKLRERERKRGH